jgi:hypothetical protein
MPPIILLVQACIFCDGLRLEAKGSQKKRRTGRRVQSVAAMRNRLPGKEAERGDPRFNKR